MRTMHSIKGTLVVRKSGFVLVEPFVPEDRGQLRVLTPVWRNTEAISGVDVGWASTQSLKSFGRQNEVAAELRLYVRGGLQTASGVL
jgi:hypothetical protein